MSGSGFGYTMHGYQNYLKEHSVASKADPIRSKVHFGYVALPPLKNNRVPPPPEHRNTSETSNFGVGWGGSWTKYDTMKKMHIRDPKPPWTYYTSPPTSASECGWWNKDWPLEKTMPWAVVPRHPQIKSEMSRFLDSIVLSKHNFHLF